MVFCIHREIIEAGEAVEQELSQPLRQLCNTLKQVGYAPTMSYLCHMHILLPIGLQILEWVDRQIHLDSVLRTAKVQARYQGV